VEVKVTKRYTHEKRVEIRKRPWRKQWYAVFFAKNGRKLAHTQFYHNRGDLLTMIATYFPNWNVEAE
jgi:hypothetical protein